MVPLGAGLVMITNSRSRYFYPFLSTPRSFEVPPKTPVEDATGGCAVRTVPKPLDRPLTLGLIDCGPALALEAWTSATCVWEVEPRLPSIAKHLPTRPSAASTYGNMNRVPKALMDQQPVDVLVIDNSWSDPAKRPPPGGAKNGAPHWSDMIGRAAPRNRPKVVIQLHSAASVLLLSKTESKGHRKMMMSMGYQQHVQLVDNCRVGGAVDQRKLVTVYAARTSGIENDLLSGVNWGAERVSSENVGTAAVGPEATAFVAAESAGTERSVFCVPNTIPSSSPPEVAGGEVIPAQSSSSTIPLTSQQRLGSYTPRPMSNLLRPFGIPYKAYGRCSEKPTSAPDAKYEPMPARVGAWIQTERGVRKLLVDELAKGLGIPKSWGGNPELVPSNLVTNLTSVHIWESLAPIVAAVQRCPSIPTPTPVMDPIDVDGAFHSAEGEWTWSVPDISVGSEWHVSRVFNLLHACKGLPDREALFQDGLTTLDVHRRNYGVDGAQQLQLLWWEFPPEHWHDLRNGCSMNFLEPPKAGIFLNSDMTDDQRATAVEFVEELMSLGVLIPADPEEIVTTCPLFILPKPGQPGQWRVLADMKKGGQNEVVGKDPVYLNRPSTVLPHLYSGGWSAVGDASKFFYQFPTMEEDQRFLGVVHPSTGKLYKYRGLPMGAGNSPAVACRIGTSLIRLCKEHYPELFDGQGQTNTWFDKFQSGSFDPKKGHGFVLEGTEDGLPAVLIYAHIDDYYIHGPTYDKTARALSAFMDKALEVGMLFNPAKVTPPSQVVKYCGFLYDTTGAPTLRIPQDKRDRAVAVLDYVLDKPGQELSRLALSVVFGILQSLVDASPSSIGQTFLQESYKVLYPAGVPDLDLLADVDVGPADPRAIFYTSTRLSRQSWDDLIWWRQALSSDAMRRPIRYDKAAMLTPTWGDGSGTGTGGTIQVGQSPTIQWQGQWLPTVLSKSSNWKEAHTCLLTMQHLLRSHGQALRGTTVFYFTDNTTTYYALKKGSSRIPALHALVRDAKLISLEMGCLLEVVHVPGTVMINQGTDGLSRGVWVSPLHSGISPVQVTAAVFAPVPVVPDLLPWVSSLLPTPPLYPLALGRGQWPRASTVLNRATLWCPQPEIAAQLLGALLALWCEVPWSTEFLMLIPRVLQGNWESLSRHVERVALIQPAAYPFQYSRHLPIPLVLLRVRPYVRSLPRLHDNVVRTPAPPTARWHRQQADHVRGLS